MSWRVIVKTEVDNDLTEAASWYEAQQTGLGVRFVQAVKSTWKKVSSNPRQYHRSLFERREVRCAQVPRFQYLVYFEVFAQDQLVVIACVIHGARDDRRWRSRF